MCVCAPKIKPIYPFSVKQSLALFLSIFVGVVAYPVLSKAAPVIPWMLFGMLFVTYAKLDLRVLKVESLHLKLLLIQSAAVMLGVLGYFLFLNYNPQGSEGLALRESGLLFSEGALICFLAPTALSAAVITVTLGGSLSRLLTYTFITNLGIVVVAPLLFSFIGTHSVSAQGMRPDASPTWTVIATFSTLLWKVIPMLLLPFIAAVLCRWLAPPVYRFVEKRPSISFYFWVVGVTLIMARTTQSVVDYGWRHWKEEVALALLALLIAIFQFGMGRSIGKTYRDPISAGQALGQKNTILAIWMAQSFLHPLASLAPASYVLWQNLINSFQLYRARHRS